MLCARHDKVIPELLDLPPAEGQQGEAVGENMMKRAVYVRRDVGGDQSAGKARGGPGTAGGSERTGQRGQSKSLRSKGKGKADGESQTRRLQWWI